MTLLSSSLGNDDYSDAYDHWSDDNNDGNDDDDKIIMAMLTVIMLRMTVKL